MANNCMCLGESTEQFVVSKLLDEDRNVYRPVVDDHGHSCQVKAGSD